MTTFNADKIKVKFGTRVDGSAVVEFEVGEYEVPKLRDLIQYTSGYSNLEVTVKSTK